MKFDFCLPIYNEEKIIGKSVEELIKYLEKKKLPIDWNITIIDNGSTDDSARICQKLASDKIKLYRLNQPGRGQALKNYWQKSAGDVVMYMDSDLAVALENIEDLVREFLERDAEVVIGSRLLPQSKINRSVLREIISHGCNLAYKLIIGYKISDTQCGFKGIKTKAFREISPYIENKKWFFDTELITFAKLFDFKLTEIPVEWREERYDQRKSKVRLVRDSWSHFINLIKLKKRVLHIKNRSKHNSQCVSPN